MWTAEQLSQFADADDCRISPFREDCETYGTPTFIWSVVAEGSLYVRAYNGRDSSWYQAALSQKAGRIFLAGENYEVSFEGAEGDINDRIDEAYREKYASSNYLGSMISKRARAATVRVLPRVS
ncbi:DUF2255 family protein [Altericroceibacterium spongiae]|uniref:DUF2255 family protein n=1 Tax=Altericroceibacterium spongiae TaxID=2320269 RepID=A0A420EFB3_9SPHN|nr:DUF2255 family protein [Altericroceibacterium spongiae]RKF19387.1 DUF2255 family protein [Altericroceibacterium spongiae]